MSVTIWWFFEIDKSRENESGSKRLKHDAAMNGTTQSGDNSLWSFGATS